MSTALQESREATAGAPRPGSTGDTRPEIPIREADASGHPIFSSGACGAVHVLAHHCEDEERPAQGRDLLRIWLDSRQGSGERWVHLQFHLALFEIENGEWDAAYRRFQRHIRPAILGGHALTDAPALAWWLTVEAPEPAKLPWGALREAAMLRLDETRDPFVLAHHLLALAGARDAAALRAWLATPAATRHQTLRRFAQGLLSYALGDYRSAAGAMRDIRPQLEQLGGSGAQNRLFAKIVRFTERLEFSEQRMAS